MLYLQLVLKKKELTLKDGAGWGKGGCFGDGKEPITVRIHS